MTNSNPESQKGYIVEFVQMEKAIEAGKLHLQDVMDNFPGVIYLSDKHDLSLLKINRNGMRILGLSDSQLASLREASFEGVVHPDHVEFVLPRFRELAQKDDPEAMAAEFMQLRIGDDYKWVFTVIKLFSPLDCLIGFSVPVQSFVSDSVKVTRTIDQNNFRISRLGRIKSLTPREGEILKLICEGKSNQEICDQLHVTINTVKSHRKSINSKLNVKSLGDLIKYAIAFDLVDF